MSVGDYWDNAEPDEAFSEARRRIMAAKASGEKKLTLANLKTLSVLPPDISDLSELSHLILHDLNVIDLAPLASLANLRSLSLSLLPASDITPLAGLHYLNALSLGMGVPVTDITTTASFRRLRYLSLEYNRYVTDISAVSNLTALKRLDLMCTSVSDVSPLTELTGLECLDLRHTEVTDLTPLRTLTSLDVLLLEETKVSDVRPLAGLRALRGLNLHNTLVSDIRPLAGLTALHWLDLQGTRVSDLVALANLTALIDACWVQNPDDEDHYDQDDDDGLGVRYLGTPVTDYYPFNLFVELRGEQCTLYTINHLRTEKGLSLYYPDGYEAPIIRSKYDLLIFVEGDSDLSILETAWQKLYPDEGRYFELRSALGAKNINITLNNERLFTHANKQKIVGILDFDDAYDHWKGIWARTGGKTILDDVSKCLVRKHQSGPAWAMLLPVPTHRTDFASVEIGGHSILSIEFLFEDKDIPRDFVYTTPLPRSGSIPVFRDKRKEQFAKHVKELPNESFGAFKPIFERWREIANGVL